MITFVCPTCYRRIRAPEIRFPLNCDCGDAWRALADSAPPEAARKHRKPRIGVRARRAKTHEETARLIEEYCEECDFFCIDEMCKWRGCGVCKTAEQWRDRIKAGLFVCVMGLWR